MLYRDFATQEELDAQYDLRTLFPEAAAPLRGVLRAGEREGPRGSHPPPRRALRPARSPSTWTCTRRVRRTRRSSSTSTAASGCCGRAREFGFVARGPASRGVATVVTNYALCPTVTMDEIVRQTRAAVAWAYRNARSFGGDPSASTSPDTRRAVTSSAMLLATDWPGRLRAAGGHHQGSDAPSAASSTSRRSPTPSCSRRCS